MEPFLSSVRIGEVRLEIYTGSDKIGITDPIDPLNFTTGQKDDWG